MLKKRNDCGFTLIEILLVIGVIMVISIIKTRDINDQSETIKAEILSSQIKTVSEATNAFLVIKYNELSSFTLPNVNCNSTTKICNLTLKNLSDQALLPPNFSTKTILGQTYDIQLKRIGVAPNYMFSGIVLTKGSTGETTQSPVFLGKALLKMGQDGGLNKENGKISGVAGGWNADETTFPILTDKKNYIGAAVGSLSGAYYVYLRRDGTLPMTGDLNLDNNNIKNVRSLNATGDLTTTANVNGANISASTGITSGGGIVASGNITSSGNINATGNIVSGGNINANGQVFAKNGYGDQIILGGDAGGADYEIKLMSAKPLTIFSPSAANYTTVLQTGVGNVKFNQRLGLMGYDPNAIPAGWTGGLTTPDIYAGGTVGAGTSGNVSAYLNSAGNIYASNNITSNTINANNIRSNGDMSAAGNFSSNTTTSNYIRSNGDMSVGANFSSNAVYSNYISSNGRLVSGEYVQVNGVANEGWGCSPNGLIGRDGAGMTLSCQSGVWRANGGSDFNSGKPGSTCGQYTYCNRASGYVFCGSSASQYVLKANVSWNGSAYGYSANGNFIRCDGLVWIN